MVVAKDVVVLDIFSTRTYYKLICLLAPMHRSTSPYGILKYIISERLDSHWLYESTLTLKETNLNLILSLNKVLLYARSVPTFQKQGLPAGYEPHI